MKTKPQSPEYSVKPSSSDSENELFVSALRRAVTAPTKDVRSAIEAAKREQPLPRERYKYVPAKPRV